MNMTRSAALFLIATSLLILGVVKVTTDHLDRKIDITNARAELRASKLHERVSALENAIGEGHK